MLFTPRFLLICALLITGIASLHHKRRLPAKLVSRSVLRNILLQQAEQSKQYKAVLTEGIACSGPQATFQGQCEATTDCSTLQKEPIVEAEPHACPTGQSCCSTGVALAAANLPITNAENAEATNVLNSVPTVDAQGNPISGGTPPPTTTEGTSQQTTTVPETQVPSTPSTNDPNLPDTQVPPNGDQKPPITPTLDAEGNPIPLPVVDGTTPPPTTTTETPPLVDGTTPPTTTDVKPVVDGTTPPVVDGTTPPVVDGTTPPTTTDVKPVVGTTPPTTNPTQTSPDLSLSSSGPAVGTD